MNNATSDREKYIERVKEARIAAGLKQEEIANYIGVDRPTYTNYESRRAMPQKYIAKFCEITKINEKWLLTGIGNMSAASKEEKLYNLMESVEQEFSEDAFISPLLQSLKAAVKEREGK